MKIVISDERKEKFDCFKQWTKWYTGAWIVSVFYLSVYCLFNVTRIPSWQYSFDIANVSTQLFVLSGLIVISPWVLDGLSNCLAWWREHYKNGVLTL